MNPSQNIPQPGEEQDTPNPATTAPKCRRFIPPVYSTRSSGRAGRPMHVLAVATFLVAFGAQAQSDTLQGRTPTTRTDRTATTQQPQGGWVMFNDQMAKDMNLTPDELKRLREMDERYQAEYLALGKDPTRNPKYTALNERRTNDIKGIMSKESFSSWQTRYGAATPGSTTPGTAAPGSSKPGQDSKPGGTPPTTPK